jgi:hypothetical protein
MALSQGFLFGLGVGIDRVGDPLKHFFAIEQEQSTAHDQQKNDTKCKNLNSHQSPSNVHVDDVANNQTANHDHATSRPEKLDTCWILPQDAHHFGVEKIQSDPSTTGRKVSTHPVMRP